MPANWLGSRSNLDPSREEGHVPPAKTSMSPLSARSNADLSAILPTKRRVLVNIPLASNTASSKDTYALSSASFRPNKIRTSKYTLLTFLPKNLYEQFRGIANFYFLSLVILQIFDLFKEVDVSITATPIIIIVSATAIKDAIEDWKRHHSDNSVNKSSTYVLGGWINNNFTTKRTSFLTSFMGIFKLISRAIYYVISLVLRLIIATVLFFARQNNRKESKTSPIRMYPEKIFAHEYMSEDMLHISTDSLSDRKPEASISPAATSPNTLRRPKPESSSDPWNVCKWEDVRVGDFVFLRNNDNIPADIVILSTSEPDSLCYVETKNLDGETNLKVKRGIRDLHHIRTPTDCKMIRGYIDLELPNPNLYSFSGTFCLTSTDGSTDMHENEHLIPISTNGILLRGCVVRNTQWIIGIVVYTGPDTKIMLNSGATPSKRSRVDRQINPQIILNFMILTVMCLICGLGSAIYARSFQFEISVFSGTTRENIDDPVTLGFLTFFRCMIIFQNIIPIALYISLDVTKTIQSFMIHLDEDMYDHESAKSVQPQSWNLCDDLGQIEYIFSDKTGTLTSNTMEFRKASIGGQMYGRMGSIVGPPSNPPEFAPQSPGQKSSDNQTQAKSSPKGDIELEMIAMQEAMRSMFDAKYISPRPSFVDARIPRHLKEGGLQAQRIREFFMVLALCHTVLVEKSGKENSESIVYNAQSPDEAALVSAARDSGFAFLRRFDNEVEVDIIGTPRTYTVLNIIEFNSDRKRMSVIVRRPEGQIILMCKGADSVIYERLSRNNDPALIEITSNHLAMFANEGLRTLCLSYRVVPEDEYQEWVPKYRAAQASITNREVECDAVAELIERDLTLMGATAIEDKLQDGVPECIATLSKAGIKIWVLTGDKMETAINIGFSCNLLKRTMILIVIKSKSITDTLKQLKEALARFWSAGGHPVDGKDYGLIIDGESLKFALDHECKPLLLELGCRCRAVICCRVSPLQKAMVVQLVRKGLNAMCLAIGDGANDVSMIQEADIGIGISGKEGLQAVMASDYAISQFRFLSRLLLVHGRWAYLRSSRLVLNYFYKNVVWLFILFWHQFFCTFSAGIVTDFTYGMFYNTIFTFLPTILIGTFDQDINDAISLQVPQIYLKGIYQSLYNMEQFWKEIADAIYQSLVCYFFGLLTFLENVTSPSGRNGDLSTLGTTIAFSAIILVNWHAILTGCSWTWITHVAAWPTLIAWVGYVIIYSAQTTTPAFGVRQELLWTPNFYLCIIISVVTAHFPHIAIRFVQQYFFPTDTDILRELQACQWKPGVQLMVDIEKYDSAASHRQQLQQSDQKLPLASESEPPSHFGSADQLRKDVPAQNLSEMDLQKSLLPPKSVKRAQSDERLQADRHSKGDIVGTGRAATDSAAETLPRTAHPDTLPPQVVTDGFGASIEAAKKSAQTDKQQLPPPSDSRSRRTSLSNVIKAGVKNASLFVRRFAQQQASSASLARTARSSSLVYMGDNGRQVENTGFAFSQDTGMSEVITPTQHMSISDERRGGGLGLRKNRPPSTAIKLRHLSNRIQNAFHIGMPKSHAGSSEVISDPHRAPEGSSSTNQEHAPSHASDHSQTPSQRHAHHHGHHHHHHHHHHHGTHNHAHQQPQTDQQQPHETQEARNDGESPMAGTPQQSDQASPPLSPPAP